MKNIWMFIFKRTPRCDVFTLQQSDWHKPKDEKKSEQEERDRERLLIWADSRIRQQQEFSKLESRFVLQMWWWSPESIATKKGSQKSRRAIRCDYDSRDVAQSD